MITAQVQYDVLARSLLIALVVVSPYGIYKLRQVRAVRRARLETERVDPEPMAPALPPLEEVIDRISALGSGEGPATVSVPRRVSIDGSPADPGVVDLLVRDALRRSALVVTAELDTPDARVLELQPGPR